MLRRLLLVVVAMLMLSAGCEQAKPKKRCCPTPCEVRVIAFTASWCGPCKAAKPALLQIQASGVRVEIIDIDEQPDLARQYGVTSVPTFFVRVTSDRGTDDYRTQKISTVLWLLGKQT